MKNNKRYTSIDILRGLTFISMALFHLCWDLVYLYGQDWDWYFSNKAYIWQQSICWTFILLSGFCQGMGNRNIKRGIPVFGSSIIITLVTVIAMPEDPIYFGVLSLLGSAMILSYYLYPILRKIKPNAGFFVSFGLFCLLRNINDGFLGFGPYSLVKMPDALYKNFFTAYLGFPQAGFYSSDYFALLPWIFLFFTGFYLCGICKEKDFLKHLHLKCAPLEFIGRHSLLLYLLHQPIIYAVLLILFTK